MPVHGDEDFLQSVQGSLLSAKDARRDSKGHALLGTANASVSSGDGNLAYDQYVKGLNIEKRLAFWLVVWYTILANGSRSFFYA